MQVILLLFPAPGMGLEWQNFDSLQCVAFEYVLECPPIFLKKNFLISWRNNLNYVTEELKNPLRFVLSFVYRQILLATCLLHFLCWRSGARWMALGRPRHDASQSFPRFSCGRSFRTVRRCILQWNVSSGFIEREFGNEMWFVFKLYGLLSYAYFFCLFLL